MTPIFENREKGKDRLLCLLYFCGFGFKAAVRREDVSACPDLGDSTISETIGIGGFCMASAPAIVNFVGSSSAEAIHRTELMYEITAGTNPAFTIPSLDFRGVPAGIDIRKVLETRITPVVNTGLAHKNPGIGQVGAGIANAPLECFEKARKTYYRHYGKSEQ